MPDMSHILGYARVSTPDQDLDGQKRRLEATGAFRVFEDVISGNTFQPPPVFSARLYQIRSKAAIKTV